MVLTVAGSDSGGGAGIQADLRTFAGLGVWGTCAVTAVTAQNRLGVHCLHPVPPEVVDAQIAAGVGPDLAPAAAKTGMLATLAIMEVVAARAAAGHLAPLVVDPVLIASSGQPLVEAGAAIAYLELLVPLAAVLTPNLDEASLLTGHDVSTPAQMAAAARRLHDAGASVVVVTGGHLPGGQALDVVFDGDQVTELAAPRVATSEDHGTGCVFSAALAAHLALGLDPLASVAAAKALVTAALGR